MTDLKINTLVQINYLSSDEWTQGAIKSFQGKHGVITKCELTNQYGHKIDRPYLVTFPEPPEKWHTYQSPGVSWWFAEHELTEVINQ